MAAVHLVVSWCFNAFIELIWLNLICFLYLCIFVCILCIVFYPLLFGIINDDGEMMINSVATAVKILLLRDVT